ncbi:MAG TPA: DNA-formamidopyrimidine glycosylase family protein [Gemmatimonadales bacterium]
MPELPDIVVYIEALTRRIAGVPLQAVRLGSPFVLRSVDPPLAALHGHRVERITRMGKRIVLHLESDDYLIVHLMIAGRLRWHPPGVPVPQKRGLAAFDFPDGSVLMTEASTRQRASIHAVHGADRLAALDPGGIEVLDTDLDGFVEALTREHHTIKRSLTDPHIVSGIGNAFSDEILHAARVSPLALTSKLDPDAFERLFRATRETLMTWTDKLRDAVGDGFPDKVTAFKDGMAVHGRYRRPCPVCGAPVQRIRYAANEVNYCAGCQTGGRVLADRAMSRLLKTDWPRSLDEWETRFG